jgi:DNA-binding MarR family transcriptional regulator
LRLTERGRALEQVIAADTDALTERALTSFDPAEREAIIRALRAIRENLTTGGRAASGPEGPGR